MENINFLGESNFAKKTDFVREIAKKQKNSGQIPWKFASEQVRNLIGDKIRCMTQ